MSLSLQDLMSAVSGSAAAFRSVTELQPVGGKGDKVFPATYANGVYSREKRRMADGRVVDCRVMNSVQAESNRAEEALQLAIERGAIQLPVIEVDFSDADKQFLRPVGKITSLSAPHRLADAILRDSQLMDGTRFSKSDYARKWGRSTAFHATAIYEFCPTALVFGMWGSPDKPGGIGAKFERAFISEIVGVDVVPNHDAEDAKSDINGSKRFGFRIDPLNASSKVPLTTKDDGGFDVGTGKTKASELNHGNIPFDSENTGVRFEFAEQTTVVSLGALRKLRFPIEGSSSSKIDDAGRTVLAALALCAGVLASEAGTSLRSRCHLWPTKVRTWELIDLPGKKSLTFEMTGEEATALLSEAVAFAKKVGLPWMEEKLLLKPTKELVELVRRSQEIQSKEKGEGSAS